MALTIKEHNGTFYLEGTINEKTARGFKEYVEFLIHYAKQTTININGVNGIDGNGMKALQELYNIALNINKKFYIVGNGCKEIYDDFQSRDVA